MQDYLPACKLVTTHGVRGELKALPLCDGAAFLAKLKRLYPSEKGGEPFALRAVRGQGSTIILQLDGIGDMDAARALVGRTLYFAKAEARLPKGRYFIDDLLGCAVIDANTGAEYGAVAAVDHPAAQDVYTVTDSQGGEHMFPAVPEFLKKIDIQRRVITVAPIPGMFDTPANGDED